MRPSAAERPSVVAIFRRHGEAYRAARPWLPSEQRRLLRDVAEGRDLGDTTTLADSGVVDEIRARAAEPQHED